MTEREKFLTIRQKTEEAKARISELTKQIPGLDDEAARLDAEAIRSEALGESGWKDRREAATKAKAVATSAKVELGKLPCAVEVLEEAEGKQFARVMQEITAEYKPRYAKALKEFVAALAAAGEAEKRMAAIRSEAYADANGSTGGRPWRGSMPPMLIGPDLGLTIRGADQDGTPLAELKARCEAMGYDVG